MCELLCGECGGTCAGEGEGFCASFSGLRDANMNLRDAMACDEQQHDNTSKQSNEATRGEQRGRTYWLIIAVHTIGTLVLLELLIVSSQSCRASETLAQTRKSLRRATHNNASESSKSHTASRAGKLTGVNLCASSMPLAWNRGCQNIR